MEKGIEVKKGKANTNLKSVLPLLKNRILEKRCQITLDYLIKNFWEKTLDFFGIHFKNTIFYPRFLKFEKP